MKCRLIARLAVCCLLQTDRMIRRDCLRPQRHLPTDEHGLSVCNTVVNPRREGTATVRSTKIANAGTMLTATLR